MVTPPNQYIHYAGRVNHCIALGWFCINLGALACGAGDSRLTKRWAALSRAFLLFFCTN